MAWLYKSNLKKAKLGSRGPGDIQETPDRGMYKTEIEKLLKAPFTTLSEKPTLFMIKRAERDALIIRLYYDTWARENELIMIDIEDIDIVNRTVLLRHTKRKVRRGKDGSTTSEVVERYTSFSEETKLMLIKYLGVRRSGPLFPSPKQGYRITDRAVRDIIYLYAGKTGIQRIIGYQANGHPRFLITPKALREAGEAYAIMSSKVDRKMAAERAGHTESVQEQNYTKFDAIRARDMVDQVQVPGS